ncbi:acyl-CoA thioesterase [Meiothermus sp. QL-1]|uniref:acyl-CoA thioesterase n=1 Tax=Meiothermus sp. QL-1 TaxID=2058095 RepID=UPI000E0B9841|nr:thioesterase family protein [Meiothermus sp. QL-1]RDI95565.1 acyl-CoA thioesterase [Meiothermus sp. QL-1]
MTARLSLAVRYAETDAMGVVHHSSYVVWLEAARVEWLVRIGLPYPEVEAQGLAFAVVELGLTYRQPARFGEVVEVEVWLAELSSRALRYQYRVWRGEVLLAEGFTRHLCQDRQGRATRIPPAIAQRLAAHLHRPD